MESIQRIYVSTLENEISYWFAVVILAVLSLSLLSRLPIFSRLLSAFDRSGATLMTTIGVLGTFTGIFLGLLDFDVSRIDDSVPKLLEGLKIAFVTSIIGMAGSISFKIVQSVTPSPVSESVEVTPEAIHAVLQSINDSVKASSEQQSSALEEVRKAISADSDSSLLTQVQKLRTSMQDGQQELIKEFREFAETMAENNSKVLIEALEQVIRDFNTQLNEQFGENFKQLNKAVGALLTWQENYREHVETLQERIVAAVTALEASRAALADIVKQTEFIPEMLKPLEELLLGLRAATTNLEAHLEAVAGLRDKAIEAFPIIEENILTMTGALRESVDTNIKQMSVAVDEQRNAQDQLRSGYDELRTASTEAQDAFKDAHNNALVGMQSAISKAMDDHTTAIEATTEELQRQIQEAWTKTQDGISAQIETLDEGMQNELRRALELLGRNLASLSEKFVEDYLPLTNRLREIVQLSRQV